MASKERIKWFLHELWRVKSGLAGFVLLFILIGLTLAFPLLANPQDIANWSGNARYWENKMLPRLAPPAWINLFSPTKYAVTKDLKNIVTKTLMLNISKDKDLMKYLELMNPKIAKALKNIPASQRKVLLSNLRKSLNFRYLIFKEIIVSYDFKADMPPNDIVAKISMGPILLKKGLLQGINIILIRPDGIALSLIPGASANLSEPFNVNTYGYLNNFKLLTSLKISSSSYTTKSGESVPYIPANTTFIFSLRGYTESLINSGNPAVISQVFGPLLSKVNASGITTISAPPMLFLMSKAVKGLVNGTAPVLKGTYKLVFALLVKVPKNYPLPQFKLERARVLGVYGLLGTDIYGRDLWPAVIYGLRWALIVGLTVAVIATFIGVFYGVIAGYLGGYADVIMTRIAQVVYSLPVLPLLIILAYFFGPSIWNVIMILIAFGWVGIVFTVRSMVLQIKENLYVEAARAIGASSWRIIFKHVFPQVLPYMFASMALSVPGAILAEAGLSFLGLGDPSIVTWGKILHSAHANGATLKGAWWWVVPPGLGIAIVGMTFVFIGYALDRILNPRLIR